MTNYREGLRRKSSKTGPKPLNGAVSTNGVVRCNVQPENTTFYITLNIEDKEKPDGSRNLPIINGTVQYGLSIT